MAHLGRELYLRCYVSVVVSRVCLTVACLFVCAPAYAQSTGAIAGLVTNTSGTPLPFARVNLFNSAGWGVSSPVAGLDGRYRITNLPPGTYFAHAELTPDYPVTPYGGGPCADPCRVFSGLPIAVQAGVDTAANFVLQIGGRITGRVTNADTGDPEHGSVTVYDSLGIYVTYVSTSFPTETYQIVGLRPGTYYLRASNSLGDVNLGELYQDITCDSSCVVTTGTPVHVTSGATTPNIDFSLDLGGSIAGTVTASGTGAPIANVTVMAQNRATLRTEFSTTGADGTYRIPRLEAGTYSVWTRQPVASNYADQAYGGVPFTCSQLMQDCSAAVRMSAPVSVAEALVTSGVDFSLPAGVRLAGTVVDDLGPLDLSGVWLYRADGRRVSAIALSGGNVFGFWSLPAGRYYLSASRPPTHSSTFYSTFDCGVTPCPLPLATAIDTTPGQIVTGLQLRLRRFGGQASIAGRLAARATGTALQGGVTACSATCTAATTDAGGNFVISGLGAGTYYLRGGTLQNYVESWHGGDPVIGGTNRGLPIVVGESQSIGGIEVLLDAGATIRGTVTTPGLSPHERTRVALYDDSGKRINEEIVLSDNRYEFNQLPPGTYHLRAYGLADVPLVSQLYGGTACANDVCARDGTPIVLTLGSSQDANFSLPSGGFITGRVHQEGHLDAGVGTTVVDTYDSAGRLVATNEGNRSFTVSGLPSGTYYLRARGRGVSEIYRDLDCLGCSPTAGTPIVVQAGHPVTGIEIVLGRGQTLSGVVRDEAGAQPISGVSVTLFDRFGVAVAFTETDLNGLYEFHDIGPGRYYASTANRVGYVDEFYQDVPCSLCQSTGGTPIDFPATAPLTGINFTLARGGWIGGRVVDANGVPVSSAWLSFYNAAGVRVQRTASASDGSYVVAVPVGSIFVQSDPLDGYGIVAYPNVVCVSTTCSPHAGAAVTVGLQTFTQGIDLALPLAASLELTPSTLPIGAVARSYAATIRSLPGGAATHFTVMNGVLPPGLSFLSEDALGRARITGTPTQAGTFSFQVRALDSTGRSAERVFTIAVGLCGLSVTHDEISFPSNGGNVLVRVSGECTWQASSTEGWLTLQSHPEGFSVLAAAAAQARTGSILVAGRLITVRQAGPSSFGPFGSLDIPADQATVVGSIAVGGWALDDYEIAHVRIYRDPVGGEPNVPIFIGDAVRVRGARPDVESLFPGYPFKDRAGWGYLLLTNMLPNQGNGTFRLHVVAEDIEGHQSLIGSRTIVAANATSVRPFGAIDTPRQGETISGSAYINFGWALTPAPKSIPADGSTIGVMIDGALVGTVNYGHFRSDVATLFPGLHNSNGAVGYRVLDTTALANGIHTISWTVTDNAGITQGIGSRYFHVDNPAPSSSITAASIGATAASAPVARKGADEEPVVVRLSEMEPLRVDLREAFGDAAGCRADYTGGEIAAGERRDLPAGSVLDRAAGLFTWQPGPGFIGSYRLEFTSTGCDGVKSSVRLLVRIARGAR